MLIEVFAVCLDEVIIHILEPLSAWSESMEPILRLVIKWEKRLESLPLPFRQALLRHKIMQVL
jgi:hypothetical protein